MKDRRKYLRIKFDSIILYNKIYRAHTTNISLGGICIYNNEPLEKEEKEFQIPLYFPTDKKTINIKAIGKPVWSNEFYPKIYESGIQFVSISEKDKKILGSYIKIMHNQADNNI